MQRVGLLTEVSGHSVWGGGTDWCGWTEPRVWEGGQGHRELNAAAPSTRTPPSTLSTPLLAPAPQPRLSWPACPWPVQPAGHLPRHTAEYHPLPQVSAETLFGNVPSLIRAHRSFWEEVLGPTLEETRASGQPLDPVSLQDGFLTVRRGQGPLPDGVELGGPRGVLSTGQDLAARILL